MGKFVTVSLMAGGIGAVALLLSVGLPLTANAKTVGSVRLATSTPPVDSGSLSAVGGPDGAWVDENNPYAPGAKNNPAYNLIYEPLMEWNSDNGQYKPWLATQWKWSDAGTVLTIQLRKGVDWTNGSAFTSADVAFTFNMMKKYPATDSNGLWDYLKSVTATGPYTVKMTLTKPNSEFFYYMSSTLIVPKAIWSKEDPETWTNPNPVGTGPFMLESFSPEDVVLKRNPHYWQGPKPYLAKVVFPAFTSNSSAILAMDQNQVQWGGTFSFDLQKSYVAKDPKDNHLALYPNGFDYLYVNEQQYPLNLQVVREAISMAVNRQKLSTIAESGYSPPVTNLLGVTPGMSSTWTTPQLEKKYKVVYNPAAAEKLLLKAGFKKGAGGILNTPKGAPFTITMDTPTPYTDFVAQSEIVASDLRQIGINVELQDHSGSIYSNDLDLGEFDIAVSQAPWGQTPFFTLYPLMASEFSAPVGQDATSNYGRYINSQAESLGSSYLLTNNVAKEVPIIEKMEQIFASQLPAIPLLVRNTPIEYSTQHLAGWPTKADPYWDFKDANGGNLPVLINLYSTSK